MYPTTTTFVQLARYAVYDKPADRILRTWILLLLGVCFLILHLLISFLQTQNLILHSLLHFFSHICSHLSFQCTAAAMIIFIFVDEGRINPLVPLCCTQPSWWCCNPWILHWIHSLSWSKALVCPSSLSLSFLSISPYYSSLPSPPKHKLIFHQFWALLCIWIASVAVMIVNGAMLNHYMNDWCYGKNAALNCQDIREYHSIIYAAFGIPMAL